MTDTLLGAFRQAELDFLDWVQRYLEEHPDELAEATREREVTEADGQAWLDGLRVIYHEGLASD